MWSLLTGAFAIAFAPILVKAVNLPSAVIGYHRCGLALLFFVPFAIFYRWQRGRPFRSPEWRYWAYMVGAGVFFAADLFVWHLSIHYVGAGISTLLANTSAIYLAIFGALFLRERPPIFFYLCLLLAFVGVYLLVGTPKTVHDRYWIGILMGLATGLFYCGYILCLRAGERTPGDILPWERMAIISSVTTVVLMGLAAWRGEVAVASGMDMVWLVLLAFVAQVCGWLLIARGLKVVAVASAGMGLLLQPVSALILGALIYGESLSELQVLGASLTLLAIYIGSSINSRYSQSTENAKSPS